MEAGARRRLGAVNILLGLGAGVTVCSRVKINERKKLIYALFNICVVFSEKEAIVGPKKRPLTVFPSIPCAPPAPYPLSVGENDGFQRRVHSFIRAFISELLSAPGGQAPA